MPLMRRFLPCARGIMIAHESIRNFRKGGGKMEELTRLIREDMKPALGVTEPGAIAFAVASAKKHTSG